MTTRWSYMVVFILFLSTSLSFGTEWRQKNIGNSDGLSNSAVISIYKDSRDYVWMGTWDGLNRYDGDAIKVFKPNVFEEGSISNNIIRDIFEDKHHNLWIVTEDGLNLFHYTTETFTSYLTDINANKYRENRFHAFLDKDSLLWCNIYGYGLTTFNYSSDSFTKPPVAQKFTGIFKKASGISYLNNKLWVLTENGTVFRVNPENQKAKKVYALKDSLTLNIGQNWIYEFQKEIVIYIDIENGGILSLRPERGKIKKYFTGDPNFNITTLSANPNNTFLWGGTDEGKVFRLYPNQQEIHFPEKTLDRFTNQHIKIWTVTETQPDLLWIGTDGDGVYRFIMENNYFSSLSKGPLSKGNLNHNIVRAVHEDSSGNLWAGTRGGGISVVSFNGSPTRVINTANGLSNNAVLALAEDKHQNIWVGTDSEGIDMIENNTGNILHFPRDFVNDVDLGFGYIYSLVFDSFGDLWIGTSGFGLLRFTIEKNGEGKYRLDSYSCYTSEKETGLRSNIVYAVVEGKPNVMWIGTRGSGLYRLNRLTGEFTTYNSNPDNQNSLNNNDVLSLLKSENQVLWIGTSGGLNRLDMSTSPYTFSHYTEKEGLTNNTIHDILQDEKKQIWVSTNKGISKVNVAEQEVKNYIKSDGLQNSEYTDGAAINGKKSDRFYFGGVDGVDWFYPLEVKDSDYFPRLAITDFTLLGLNKEKAGNLSTMNIDQADSLIFKHNQNFFRFSYTALNYHNKEKTRYKYSLKGIQNSFYIEDKGHEATFTNIPPGEYWFSASWTNENGIWHPQSRKIHITILPPFWQTTWAYLVYGTLFAGMMSIIIYFIIKKYKTRHKITIDRLEFEKIKEMNQYKFQFFTNIAHEFRTPLTLIMAPAAKLMDIKGNDPESKPYLQSIYNNATRLLHLIRELIDYRKVETGKFSLKVKYENLSAFLTTIKKAFEQYAQQKNIRLKLIIPEHPVYGWFDNRILEKIMLNLISNAIKYSYKHGEVIVKLEEHNDTIDISVKDTGVGISEKYQNKIFDRFFQQSENLPTGRGYTDSAGVGLSLTKSLTELHKGSIHLESIPGQGSNFTIDVPVSAASYTEKERSTEMIIDEEKIRDRAKEEFIGEDQVTFASKPVELNKTKNNSDIILVVDDNEQIRNLIADILYPEYTIVTAKNGLEALEILKEQDISVVISDIIMPDMDGLALLRNIKENAITSHLPVILLTAKGELEHRIEGIESGADSYIPKPFDPRHLKVRVKKLIENRNKLQQTIRNKGFNKTDTIQGLNKRDAEFIKKINSFIENNIDNEELDAEDLVKQVYISKTQLYRKVKAITRFTPHGLIKNIRLNKAAELLKKSDLTVSEIIYETGFKNRTYFYRSFKELFGDSPLDYAQKSEAEDKRK